jgi:chemotaxis protein MotB
MARKKHTAHENHERWLVSYADFITLLFAFFVVMFATTQADKGKAKQMSDSVTAALEDGGVSGVKAAVAKVLGGTLDDKGQGNAQMKGPGGAQKAAKEDQPVVAELVPSLKALNESLKQEIDEGKLEVNLQPRGLVVSLRQAAFFPSGEDTIDPKVYPVIDKLARTLATVKNPLLLEGHTDSVPIHTARFPSNWELSAARAIALLNVLSTKYSIPPGRMAVSGYADTVPMGSNDTPEGKARNRRVDLIILSKLAIQTAAKGAAPAGAAKPAPAKPAASH